MLVRCKKTISCNNVCVASELHGLTTEYYKIREFLCSSVANKKSIRCKKNSCPLPKLLIKVSQQFY